MIDLAEKILAIDAALERAAVPHASGTADVHQVLGWLVDLLGVADHRVDRLRGLLHDGDA